MKVDFKKSFDSYKAKRGKFSITHVPTLQYLMIDGHKGPVSAEFSLAIQELYPVAYTLKFMSKLTFKKDYVVPPLEALWWADDMDVFTTKFDQSKWDWTVMIMTPDWITEDMLKTAVDQVAAKKNEKSANTIRLEKFNEGTCAQILHIGAYAEEGPILKKMHDEFIPENGYKMQGKHHEIYFSDFRKTAPEKLRTILRQPVVIQD
ncbi:MAG: GyrI-like domain-containing protein [Sneathiella sp.]